MARCSVDGPVSLSVSAALQEESEFTFAGIAFCAAFVFGRRFEWLARRLSLAGVLSRREAEKAIAAGFVTVRVVLLAGSASTFCRLASAALVS